MIRFSLLCLAGGLLACSGLPTGLPGSSTPSAPGTAPVATPVTTQPAPLPVASGTPDPSGIPYYYTRAITAADLQNRPLKELSLIRNTIYARAGNPFRKAWLNEYFSSQPWYRPGVGVDTTKLSVLDYKNAEFVGDYEARIPRAELVQRRDRLIAQMKRDGDGDGVELVLLARALGENAWNYEIQVDHSATDMEVSPFDDPRILDSLVRVDQLRDLSRRDLRILRNMVYARHGRAFKSELLQLHFERQSWYKVDPAYSDAKLSEVDKRNVQIIRSVEDSLGGPLTDYQHKSEEGWFTAA